MQIKNIFWDLDGTLVESNVEHAKAWTESFEKLGFRVRYETVRRLIGVGGSLLTERALNHKVDEELNAELNRTKDNIFEKKYLENIKGFPDVGEHVRKIGELGIWQAILTGSKPEIRDILLKKAGLADIFSAFYSSSEVAEPKPSPQILQYAMEQENISPKNALLIGDTIYDEQVADAAGVPFVAVLCGGAELSDFSKACRIFTSPVEICKYLIQNDFVLDN